jgi:DNA-binding transcriptional LysR family regulator
MPQPGALPARAAARSEAAAASPGNVRSLLEVNPRLLRCFVALAEELHFGRAAARLYVAQPALSRSIKQLEQLLGRQLFVRTTRTVELTPAGERVLPAVRDVLDSMAALIGDLAVTHRTLRVAHAPGSDTLALILDGLASVGAGLAVKESTMGSADQLDALLEGQLDVALCRRPDPSDRRFDAELVRFDPLLIAVLGRAPGVERPVDPRKRTVAVGDGGWPDRDFSTFVADYERALGTRLRRVAVSPGSGAEAHALRRAGATAFVRLASQGRVPFDRGCPAVGATPLQAYFPWAIVCRRGQRSPGVTALVEAARRVARARGWLDTTPLPGEPWIPGPSAGTDRGARPDDAA